MLVIAAAVLAVAGLIHLGAARLSTQGVQAVAAPAKATGAFTQMLDNARLPLPRLILQVVVIVVVARAFGFLARRVGQSPVIGEIAAGVLLGPSVLGWMAPETSGFLFPSASMPILQLLSQIGVLLFMFVVGVELEPAYLRGKAHAAIAVSHFSIIIPFILGVALSLALYAPYALRAYRSTRLRCSAGSP
jgi:Sodium/hydrogen exchanger family